MIKTELPHTTDAAQRAAAKQQALHLQGRYAAATQGDKPLLKVDVRKNQDDTLSLTVRLRTPGLHSTYEEVATAERVRETRVPKAKAAAAQFVLEQALPGTPGAKLRDVLESNTPLTVGGIKPNDILLTQPVERLNPRAEDARVAGRYLAVTDGAKPLLAIEKTHLDNGNVKVVVGLRYQSAPQVLYEPLTTVDLPAGEANQKPAELAREILRKTPTAGVQRLVGYINSESPLGQVQLNRAYRG